MRIGELLQEVDALFYGLVLQGMPQHVAAYRFTGAVSGGESTIRPFTEVYDPHSFSKGTPVSPETCKVARAAAKGIKEVVSLTEYLRLQRGFKALIETTRARFGHYQDGGLYEARAAVEVPVLALGETSMLYACMLGRNIGLVTINPVFIPMHEDQVSRYGLRERITAIKAIRTDPTELNRAFTDASAFEAVLRQFREQVQPLVDDGAEVIIPAGGLPALLFSRLKDFTVGGAVVLNCIAVLATMTVLAVKLRLLTGTRVSRASTFAKPSEKALQEFLDSLSP